MELYHHDWMSSHSSTASNLSRSLNTSCHPLHFRLSALLSLLSCTSRSFSLELLPKQLLDVRTMMTLKLSLNAFYNFTTDRWRVWISEDRFKIVKFITRIDFMQFAKTRMNFLLYFYSLVNFSLEKKTVNMFLWKFLQLTKNIRAFDA